jgi:hypothetical protein
MSDVAGVAMRQAPVVGDEGCVRFVDGSGYASLPASNFSLGQGFSFLLDFQGDRLEEQTVFGAREKDGSTLILIDSPGQEWGVIRLEIVDRSGRAFVADARTSGSHGRRIACRVLAEDNRLEVAELQPWTGGDPLKVAVRRADSPHDFPPFRNPIFLSGCNVDGTRQGQFLGRAAEFAIFDNVLAEDRLVPLRSSSKTRADDDLPRANGTALDEEGRQLFVEDVEQLREWVGAGRLDRRDTRAASTLAFRWICDRRPLLKRLSDYYGVLLSLPDLNPMRSYTEAVLEDQPVFLYHRDRWEGDWLALSAFLGDMAFWVGDLQRQVSWEAFIKFVRNKLGGGHFDPDERRRWQVQLDVMFRATEIDGEAWIDVKMLVLVRALLVTAESCGLEALARYPLS